VVGRRSSTQILGRAAGHWPILIVSDLRHGPRRFTELLQSIEGIHQRSLSEALRKLERDGLLTRTIVPTFPRRSDHELTPRGGTLQVATAPLVRWAGARAVELANGIDRSPGPEERPEARPG
jgi:DNA-binding HxlR family transcriptional regulator